MLSETILPFPVRLGGNAAPLPQNPRRLFADIRALDRALVSSDLPAARAAFERMQEDSPFIAAALSRDPFPAHRGPRPLRALRVLGHCLLRGNLVRARRAFEQFC